MTRYEMGKYWLLHTLETYRDTPSGDAGRKFIDWLMERSRQAADNAEEKKLHNLVVLRYITDTRPPKRRICNALHVGRQNYERTTEHAVDRLLVLAFGLNGINWNGEAQKGTPNSP